LNNFLFLGHFRLSWVVDLKMEMSRGGRGGRMTQQWWESNLSLSLSIEGFTCDCLSSTFELLSFLYNLQTWCLTNKRLDFLRKQDQCRTKVDLKLSSLASWFSVSPLFLDLYHLANACEGAKAILLLCARICSSV
jgi:hypothetical protein